MTRENIMAQLENRGYEVEPHTISKNGEKFDAIRVVTNSNVSPIIYTEPIIEDAEKKGKSVEEVVDDIVDIVINQKVEFDLDALFEEEYIKKNIYIGLQKTSEEPLVKKASGLEGIESYLYIKGGNEEMESYTIKLNKDILDRAEVFEDDAWEWAEENTNAESTITSLAKMVADMIGMECPEEVECGSKLFVISNKDKFRGASAILNKKMLAEFGREQGVERIIVLPSSIHEMIVLPFSEDANLEDFSAMVSEVNGTVVSREERLTNRAYVVAV